jgi:phosphoglucosamine mutase
VKIYPQVLKNVRVTDKDTTLNDERVQKAVSDAEKRLGANGRVLLRKSGTEPVLRVMAEAPTKEECEENVDAIIAAMNDCGYLIG